MQRPVWTAIAQETGAVCWLSPCMTTDSSGNPCHEQTGCSALYTRQVHGLHGLH